MEGGFRTVANQPDLLFLQIKFFSKIIIHLYKKSNRFTVSPVNEQKNICIVGVKNTLASLLFYTTYSGLIRFFGPFINT